MTPRLRSTSAILVAFAVSLGVYVASLRGGISYWDTGDLQTVPYILGIPYPTGFPGFVLVGWLWTHLLPIGSVAWRMNLLAAVATAGSVAALTALLLTSGAAVAVALGAAALFALADTVWTHATYVDVHPVSFACCAWAFVFALCWHRDGRLGAAGAALACAAAALALDNTTVLMLPGLLVLALGRRPPLLPALRWCGVALAAVVAAYAYLPLRSAVLSAARVDPTLALGLPPGRPFWDDGHPSSLAGFLKVVAGTRFAPHEAAFAMLGRTAFGRLVTDFGPVAYADLTEPILWLALFGAALRWWRGPVVLAALVLFAAVPMLFIFAYPSESDTSRYYLGGLFVLAALAGYAAIGLGTLPTAPRTAAAMTGAILAAAVLSADVAHSDGLFAQPGDLGAVPFVNRIVRDTPANAIVVAPWLYATPLGYAAYVEKSFGDRIVVTADPLEDLAFYRAWLASRPVYVVSGEAHQTFPGFTAHTVDVGDPSVYALR